MKPLKEESSWNSTTKEQTTQVRLDRYYFKGDKLPHVQKST
jgi:hypothetical protein